MISPYKSRHTYVKYGSHLYAPLQRALERVYSVADTAAMHM